MCKKVLVIGGGKWQVPIIQKAKELGHYVICSNLYEDSVGFAYADESYVANVLDTEMNLSIAKKVNPDAVITDQSDIAVKTVAYVSETLGLKGIGTDIADLYTNKLRMRQELNIPGLHHPQYKICCSKQDVIDFFKSIQNAIIIKPLANQSSRGIYKIVSQTDIETLFDITMGFSINGQILAEEYIGGFELTVEGFKSKDDHTTLAVSKKSHYASLPSVAQSLTYLNEFSDFDRYALEKINDQLFDPLLFGITHVEYKFYNGRFYLIEAAVRGGGTKISSHIIPMVSGVDVNRLLIEEALGKQPAVIQKRAEEKCVILKFFDFPVGKVAKINGLDYLTNNVNIIDFDFEFKIGETISSPDDDRSRIGYYIACADTEGELMKIVENVDKKVWIDYV